MISSSPQLHRLDVANRAWDFDAVQGAIERTALGKLLLDLNARISNDPEIGITWGWVVQLKFRQSP
jgi:hypothetical protein